MGIFNVSLNLHFCAYDGSAEIRLHALWYLSRLEAEYELFCDFWKQQRSQCNLSMYHLMNHLVCWLQSDFGFEKLFRCNL